MRSEDAHDSVGEVACRELGIGIGISSGSVSVFHTNRFITLYTSYTSLEPIASCRKAINALCELALSNRSLIWSCCSVHTFAVRLCSGTMPSEKARPWGYSDKCVLSNELSSWRP